jgi:membrane-associated protein
VFADLLHGATLLVDRLTTLDEWSVLFFTYLSSAVEMTFLLGLLVPGESVVMLAASLHGPGGFALAVAAGTAGALSGQILGYAIGRVFGARLRDTRLGRRIGAQRFDRAEAYLRERGAPALVAVRFVAVIHAVVPIVAGVARMPFRRFLGWSALGTLLWVGAFAGVGAATASADSTGGIGVVLTAIGATCLGVVPFAVRLIRRSVAGSGRKAPLAARLFRRPNLGRAASFAGRSFRRPARRGATPLTAQAAGRVRPLTARPLTGVARPAGRPFRPPTPRGAAPVTAHTQRGVAPAYRPGPDRCYASYRPGSRRHGAVREPVFPVGGPRWPTSRGRGRTLRTGPWGEFGTAARRRRAPPGRPGRSVRRSPRAARPPAAARRHPARSAASARPPADRRRRSAARP